MMAHKCKKKMLLSLDLRGFLSICHTVALSAVLLLSIIPVSEARDLVAKPTLEDLRAAPEITTGLQESAAVTANDFMIVTANPLATKAGYDILKRGGSAADAAIAAQAMLGLVEPQSSGLGGGAFVLYYDAKTKKLSTYDARETAPKLASPFLFYKNGKPMGFKEAAIGGRSVGAMGVPALLEHLHQAHGTLTWMELFESAIKTANNGFIVSPRLEKLVAHAANDLARFKDTADYFIPNGVTLSTGNKRVNKPYAETLKDFAFYGANIFYRGALAQKITTTVQNIQGNAGLLTSDDLQAYEIKKRDPLCAPYRAYIVCSMGEPSSGGLTLLQILGMAAEFDLAAMGKGSPQAWNIITQASRLAFADRAKYMADPDFVNTPNTALLDPDYIAARAKRIQPSAPLRDITAGAPPLWEGPLYESGWDYDTPGTTHISIIDKDGNALSMTSSIEGAFGSHVMVDGFLLNNQLTDFSFSPFDGENTKEGLVANMVEGGKRPRSSMAPTIVFDQSGAPVLVIGSAGGSRIIGYVLQRIISVLDWGMNAQDAMNEPHILARDNIVEMERGARDGMLLKFGIKPRTSEMSSGLTAIHRVNDNLIGAVDPRREGAAAGD